MTDELDENDLASQIVAALERSRTTSANVLRDKCYRVLGKLGVDIVKLVNDARGDHATQLRLTAKRSARRRQLLKMRIDREEIPADRLPAAIRSLQNAPRRAAAQKRALDLVLHRPPVWSSDPTPERRRHATEEAYVIEVVPAAGPVRATVAHQFKWAVDEIADLLSAQEYEAAESFHWAYFSRLSHAKIGGYGDGGSASDPARRLPLTPEQQHAGREWAMWSKRIPPALRPILFNFVLGIPPRGADKPLSRAEFGKVYGRCKGDHQARGVADGALKAACGLLAGVWAEYEDWMLEQNASIKKAALENDRIRTLIKQGALSEAAREIQAETRAREAERARGVNPSLALNWLQYQEAREAERKKSGEPKTRSR
jgi:hypothetical protein